MIKYSIQTTFIFSVALHHANLLILPRTDHLFVQVIFDDIDMLFLQVNNNKVMVDLCHWFTYFVHWGEAGQNINFHNTYTGGSTFIQNHWHGLHYHSFWLIYVQVGDLRVSREPSHTANISIVKITLFNCVRVSTVIFTLKNYLQ